MNTLKERYKHALDKRRNINDMATQIENDFSEYIKGLKPDNPIFKNMLLAETEVNKKHILAKNLYLKCDLLLGFGIKFDISNLDQPCKGVVSLTFDSECGKLTDIAYNPNSDTHNKRHSENGICNMVKIIKEFVKSYYTETEKEPHYFAREGV